MKYLDGYVTVLAGYGFGDQGPYLRFNDIDAQTQHIVPVVGKTFSLVRQSRRFCTGRFDLRTFQREVCPLKVELLPTEKDEMCPACREATGFNPSFYYAETISPQQREYNQTPHFVYLAYFSSSHIKAGISSETRGIERLLEQGARVACIVGRFADADDARTLEAALCAQAGILETMRASLKARLLAEEKFDPAQAAMVLTQEMQRLAGIEAVAQEGFAPEDIQDLSACYFGGPSPDVSELQLPEGHEGECAGTCIGMVGGLLVLKQGAFSYIVSLKEWESHVVDLYEDEVRFVFDSVPQQASLF